MKVLVTGATGFIGSYVIQKLLNLNYEVIASSRNKLSAENFDWYPKVTYLPLDLSTQDVRIDYYTYFNSPDRVIHLAWEGLPNFKALFHFEDNLWRHYQFLKNLVTNGAKNITVTGTCLEYGMVEGELKEDMCVNPTTSYGLAKNTLYRFLQQLQGDFRFSLKWMRLFYLFGKGQHPKSILSQLQKALDNDEKEFKMSGGKQSRDYMNVELVADYIVAASLQDEIDGIINCSSNNPITINQLVQDYLRNKEKTIELVRGFYPYPDYEPMHFWGNNSKIRKIL